MSTTGGNWKEFWLSASQPGGGDLDLIEFHLRNGVDPNYQHPEMESTALCDAVRAGNEKVVEFLLNYHLDERGQQKEGVRVVDPTIPSAYENQTPLEIAMEIQHHVMVDMILKALPPKRHADESRYCRRILVTIPDDANVIYYEGGKLQYATAVVTQVLRLGHRMMVLAPTKTVGHGVEDDPSLLRAHFAKETGNAKFWSVPSMEEISSLLSSSFDCESSNIPTKIDTWLCFPGGGVGQKDASLLDLLRSEFIRPCSILSNDENATPDRVWLMIPSTSLSTQLDKQQLVWFLEYCQSQNATKKGTTKVNAMIIPCTWRDSLWRGGSPCWIEMEVIGCLLEMNENDGTAFELEAGGIYNNKLEQLPWAETIPNPDQATGSGWEEMFSELVEQ